VTVSEGTAATTAAPVPTDAQPQSNTNCGEWHEVRCLNMFGLGNLLSCPRFWLMRIAQLSLLNTGFP
jgi:hypothetical protein